MSSLREYGLLVVGAVFVAILVSLCTMTKTSKFDARCEDLCKSIDKKVDYCSEDKGIAICK